MRYSIIYLFLCMISITTCRKAENCPSRFQLLASITPYSEVYVVGDTITIQSKFSKNILEVNLNKTYDMEGVKWYPLTRIANIDTLGIVRSHTKENFEFISNSLYNYYCFTFSSDNSSVLTGELNYQNDSFDLEVKLITQTPGLYYLGHGSTLFNDDQDFPGNCRQVGIEGYTLMNDGMDNNIHLLQESPEPHYNTWILQKPDERFHRGGGYCFRVVE